MQEKWLNDVQDQNLSKFANRGGGRGAGGGLKHAKNYLKHISVQILLKSKEALLLDERRYKNVRGVTSPFLN